MYFKEIVIDKSKNNIEFRDLNQRLKDSKLIQRLEEKSNRFEGIDHIGKLFAIKYYDSLVYLQLEISSESYEFLENLMESLFNTEITIKETKIEDQFQLLREIRSDVRFLKNVTIFILVLVVVTLLLSIIL